jgi:hypothetical protein
MTLTSRIELILILDKTTSVRPPKTSRPRRSHWGLGKGLYGRYGGHRAGTDQDCGGCGASSYNFLSQLFFNFDSEAAPIQNDQRNWDLPLYQPKN